MRKDANAHQVQEVDPFVPLEEDAVELVIRDLEEGLNIADARPGEPAYILTKVVIAGLRMTRDLSVVAGGKCRAGVSDINQSLERYKFAISEERAVIKEDTARITSSVNELYAKAVAKVADELNARSETIAAMKIKFSLTKLVFVYSIAALVLVASSSFATYFMTYRYIQVGVEATASQLYRAAAKTGPDRVEAWLRIIENNDPLDTWGACFNGQSLRSRTGQEACEAAVWIGRRPPAPKQ